ncbi:poly adp ribose polymerase [Echinococcus multilocularis]|uniref:NAD(+) ADP-ribosyltransferase n=1 Tax=Echinococcus multilocularis TaxID=6211 RepID=A0A068Y184_ECHMU|nr:poly adp ribose polymerase [Echinococcus multilocularis]
MQIKGLDMSSLIGSIISLDARILHDFGQKASDSNVNPLDEHYEKLKSRIKVPLNRDSEKFEWIAHYLYATYAAMHFIFYSGVNGYFLRELGAERLKALNSRIMLWYGACLINCAGILWHPTRRLRQGVFGKGAYSSDMASKSANYLCLTLPPRAAFTSVNWLWVNLTTLSLTTPLDPLGKLTVA